MKKIWNHAPMVRLLLPFIGGIIAGIQTPSGHPVTRFLLAILLTAIAKVVLIPRLSISYKKSWWFGLLTTASLLILGFMISSGKNGNLQPFHFSKYKVGRSGIYQVVIKDAPVEKERSLKCIVSVEKVLTGGHVIPANGKALLYLQKDSSSLHLRYGDELLLNASFEEIEAPANPGEFDYKRFLSFHTIYQQAYVKSGQWWATGQNKGNGLFSHSLDSRDRLLAILDQNGLKDDELSVGAALMLGYTDKLDADILSAYSGTGALHVLSVSGLHVAIVYFVFNWLLFFLDKVKYGPLLKSVLLILFLWFYAALTGLSPSVLRAATMFSFIIIANTLKKHANIYNTLAASAFLLLLIDPFLIMDVGFQLSYIAVIGIVTLQPLIRDWLEPKYWISEQVWEITAVSIAAQLATFPLGLYYFHQFPNYFLISNLVVIPISTIIIYLGIALFVSAPIPVFVKYIAIVFSWSVWLLNFSVKWIEGFPFALTDNISISGSETCLLYLTVISFIFYFIIKKFNYLFISLSLVILLLSWQVIGQHREQRQQELVVYKIPGFRAIDLIRGRTAYSAIDPSEIEKVFSHIKPNRCQQGIERSVTLGSFQKPFLFRGRRIAIADKAILTKSATVPLKLDYLILSGEIDSGIMDILKVYDPSLMIFDSSVNKKKIKQWERECKKAAREYYTVSEKGAFVLQF